MKQTEIPVDDVKIMENIRLDETEVSELMEDIKQHGLLHPIGVYNEKGEYILAYGSRRLMACKKLGWEKIPAQVYDQKLTEKEFLSVNASENIHRKDITPIELGRVCQKLQELGLSISEISARLSQPKTRIETALQLYRLVPEEFRPDVSYLKQREEKKGKVSATTMNTIIRARNISKGDVKQMIVAIKKQDLSLSEVRLVLNLKNQGMNLKEALEKKNDYINVAVEYPFRKKKVEEIRNSGDNLTNYVRNILKKQGLL